MCGGEKYTADKTAKFSALVGGGYDDRGKNWNDCWICENSRGVLLVSGINCLNMVLVKIIPLLELGGLFTEFKE